MPNRAFYEALGRVMHRFAAVERALQMAVHTAAGTTPESARVLFGGLRVDEGIKLLKKLGGDDCDEDVRNALTQLKKISDVRNRLVHMGANFDQGVVAYQAFTPRQDYAEPVDVRSERLIEMANDLMMVEQGIIIFILNRSDTPAEILDSWRAMVRRPWQYTGRAAPLAPPAP